MTNNLIAPNGKPSNLNAEQYALVRTPAFKKWFGDWENDPESASKVVDSNGEPFVVYHGTDSKFNIFDKNLSGKLATIEGVDRKIGIYFSNKKSTSEFYTKGKGVILECFLNVRKPSRMKGGEISTYEIKIAKEEYGKDGIIWNRGSGIWINGKPMPLQEGEIAEIEYIVFEPNQIKLADGSNTTFDAENPDIRYADGGAAGEEITCINCGWNWNTRDSDESDKYVCHKCGFDNKAFYDPRLMDVMADATLLNLKKNGILLRDKENQITLIAYNTENRETGAALYNKALIYKSVKPIKQANEIIEMLDNQLYEEFDESKIEEYKKSNRLIIMNQNEVVYDSENPNMSYADGGLIAPNGKSSNLTEEQYRLVRTPEFKAWFGDWENDPQNASKVVDENGEPKVVYHGTKETFYVFKMKLFGYVGFYFSDKKEVARTYGSKVRPFFLNSKNFKSADMKGGSYHDNHEMVDEFIRSAEYYGHDFHLLNFVDPLDPQKAKKTKPSNIYVIMNQSDIKLADGSNTTFDAENPDIRYAKGGQFNRESGLKKLAKEKKATITNAFDQLKKSMLADQYKIVRTSEFKNWFGDWQKDPNNCSVIREKNGEPMVVWHGSPSKFNIFKNVENGVFYFAENGGYASHFADGTKNTYPYYLNIRKIFDALKFDIKENEANFFIKEFGINTKWLKSQDKLNKRIKFWELLRHDEDFRKYLIKQGYDGIRYVEDNDDGWIEKSVAYGCFNANQIKLANGVNTTFSTKSKDIRYADGGAVQVPSTEDLIQLVVKERENKIREWYRMRYKVVVARNDGYSYKKESERDSEFIDAKNPSRKKVLDIINSNPDLEEIRFNGTIKVGNRVGEGLEIADDFSVLLWKKENSYADGGITEFNKNIQDRVKEIKEDYKYDGSEKDLSYVNSSVAVAYLQYLADSIGAKYYQWDFHNESKMPTNHFQIDMELEGGNILSALFVYVDDNHRVVKSKSNVKLLDEDYNTIKVLVEEPKFKSSMSEYSFEYKGITFEINRFGSKWMFFGKYFGYLQEIPQLEAKSKNELIIKIKRYLDVVLEYEQKDNFAKGGLSKTPAPKKDRVFGSDKNKVGSAASKESAKKIELSDSIVTTLQNKAKEYNEDNSGNKVTLNTIKAVMRRGMGAYSTSHRPTITGGAPNSRQAWGFARVNKFLKKKSGEKVKAAYVQDDDLLESGAILNLSCKDYISENEAVLKTGYYLDLREFSSINDPYGQIPLNLKHTLVTYNSGNQDGLSLIDTINPISLQKELAEILNIPMNNAHVVVGLYIKMAKKLKSVSDIKSDNIIVMDRDRLVCKSDAGDLFRMGGNINKNNFKMIQQHYQSMKPIGEIQVGDIYLIKEDMFAPHQDHELPQHLSTRYATVEVKSPCHKNLDAYVLEVMDCDCDHVAGKYAKGKIIERSRKHILSSGKLKHAVAKNEPTEFKDGGELNADSQLVKEYFAHDSGDAGGLLVGKRHSEGGIKADVKSTGQKIEVEGGEAIITRGAVNSKKKYLYEGKEMTTREILSDLNVKGGGVAFADGGDVPEKINCGCSSMKVGGVSYTPQDFLTLSEKEYQEHRLIDGIEKERNDHFYTLAKLNSGAISIEQALREIASKEMMIDPKYPYSE